MKQKKLVIVLSAVLALVAIVGISAYAASNYGTQSDPLVTLSYIDNILTPKLMDQVKGEINSSVKDIDKAIDDAVKASGNIAAETYTLVTLTEGQTLTGGVGAELILRSGDAFSVGGAYSALIDTTTGDTSEFGAYITANHLYLATDYGAGVICESETATFLVRGNCTIS